MGLRREPQFPHQQNLPVVFNSLDWDVFRKTSNVSVGNFGFINRVEVLFFFFFKLSVNRKVKLDPRVRGLLPFSCWLPSSFPSSSSHTGRKICVPDYLNLRRHKPSRWLHFTSYPEPVQWSTLAKIKCNVPESRSGVPSAAWALWSLWKWFRQDTENSVEAELSVLHVGIALTCTSSTVSLFLKSLSQIAFLGVPVLVFDRLCLLIRNHITEQMKKN